MYTMHDTVYIEISWTNITTNHNKSNIAYILRYPTNHNRDDMIITESASKIIIDSFLNNHYLNITSFNDHTIGSVRTMWNFNDSLTSNLVSAASTNCTLIIPSQTTSPPLTGTSISNSDLRFDGPYCHQYIHQCGCSSKYVKYDNISKIQSALNETYIIRDDHFHYDLSVALTLCINRTDSTLPNCTQYNDTYNGDNDTLPLSLSSILESDTVSLDIMNINNFDAATVSLNCSVIDINTESTKECGLGTPMEVTFKLVTTIDVLSGGDVFVLYEYWWFWILLSLSVLILFCMLCLFRLIRRQRMLNGMLWSANEELKSKRKENEDMVFHKIKKSAFKSPNYTPNPLGNGVPNSMPLLDPIEQELNARQADPEMNEHFVCPNDEIFDAFDYRIQMQPNQKKSSHSEMMQLDGKGRKKTQGWKVSMEQPLLQ